MRGYEWIDHDTIEVSVESLRDFAKYYEIRNFAFQAAWCSSTCEVKCGWPLGLQAVCPLFVNRGRLSTRILVSVHATIFSQLAKYIPLALEEHPERAAEQRLLG